ncbi:hypothetical protein SS50377_27424 [Spironucleus salmonicida]|uniref:Uncharacterized protein n=1 Tax=Spironucleus salmonicida TaxID=348837 RepID=V6LFG7_9EUKA|nr:hypothetical protein SS50377_27424 [Spironucleus salmonicida]|eukprot:EST43285.1 Hypothetical protein SS50377_16950 [Spironucleus salmonicida]
MSLEVSEIQKYKIGENVSIKVKGVVFKGQISEHGIDKMTMIDTYRQGQDKPIPKTNIPYKLVESIQNDAPIDILDVILDKPHNIYELAPQVNNKQHVQKQSHSQNTDNNMNIEEVINDGQNWDESKKVREQKRLNDGIQKNPVMNGFFDNLTVSNYNKK